MTEFAIVLPVLALVLFGIMQLGILFNNYVTLTDAVRAGGRQAAVGRSVPDPTGATISRVRGAADGLKQADLTVTVTAAGGWAQGSDVTVRATYPYSVNLLGLVVGSGTLVSTMTERVE
jgi:Flp pilus assembly protein TadG